MIFKEKVLTVVAKIPEGKTMTYKQVAILAGNPRAYRAVGNILNKNRSSKVPCHRIIRSNGQIGGYNNGPAKKKFLLKKERQQFLKRRSLRKSGVNATFPQKIYSPRVIVYEIFDSYFLDNLKFSFNNPVSFTRKEKPVKWYLMSFKPPLCYGFQLFWSSRNNNNFIASCPILYNFNHFLVWLYKNQPDSTPPR